MGYKEPLNLAFFLAHAAACQKRKKTKIRLYFFAENFAPIAQLDRVTDYESVGRKFESCWARH